MDKWGLREQPGACSSVWKQHDHMPTGHLQSVNGTEKHREEHIGEGLMLCRGGLPGCQGAAAATRMSWQGARRMGAAPAQARPTAQGAVVA